MIKRASSLMKLLLAAAIPVTGTHLHAAMEQDVEVLTKNVHRLSGTP